MSALEKKITSNEDRISSTKRPRSDKCPSPSKRLPLTSSRVLHSRVLILRGLYQCVLHDSSVHRCWYWSFFLTFRGSNQRVLHDQMLLLIVKSYDQGSVLIVNFYIQCVSCDQMLILTLQCHMHVEPVS